MRILQRGNDDVLKIWPAFINSSAEYRLIRLSVLDGKLIYHTATDELAVLDESELELIRHLPHKFCPEMSNLIRHHFLVPADMDEAETVDRLRQINDLIKQQTSFTRYTILPTSACNAHCFYCYESDYPHITMTEETAEQTACFICAHSDSQPITISWFGGEPLVGRERIRQICRILTDKGVSFTSLLITNASLLTEELVSEAAAQWHLTHVQVTLDGTEAAYNQIKAYRHLVGNPYQTVLRNIHLLLRAGINVAVRLNFDRHNLPDIRTLIDELAERFGPQKNLQVYARALFDDEGFDKVRHSDADHDFLNAETANLYRCIAEKGFGLPQRKHQGLRFYRCMADNPASLVINPLGQIGKCEHCSFDHLIGDIWSDRFDPGMLAHWKETRPEQELCHSCPFYPSCIHLAHCPPDRPQECTPASIAQRVESRKRMMRHAIEHRHAQEERSFDESAEETC